jgi:hypothetical protein
VRTLRPTGRDAGDSAESLAVGQASIRGPYRTVAAGGCRAVHAEPVVVPPGQSHATISVTLADGIRCSEKQQLTIRALAEQPGDPPTLSATAAASPMAPELLAVLKTGALPVIAETTVLLRVGEITSPAR